MNSLQRLLEDAEYFCLKLLARLYCTGLHVNVMLCKRLQST